MVSSHLALAGIVDSAGYIGIRCVLLSSLYVGGIAAASIASF